jgi:energy-coupling factor transporter transmembrane protein EcfT
LKPAINNIETPYQPVKDNSKKVMTISVFAFFIGFALIIVLYPYILINFFTLTKIFIGFTVIGFVIPLKFYRKWFQFIKYEMILFNILGAGPLLTGLFLSLNLLITTNAQTINYEIIGCKINGNSVDLELRSEIQHINPKITSMNDVDMAEFTFAKTIDITLADGIFGFKVIKDRTFKP